MLTLAAVVLALTVFAPANISTNEVSIGYSAAFALGDSEDGGCCGSDDGGNDDGGNTGGGGNDSNPPSCSIDANITSVVAGDTYIISWNGTSGATYRVNNALVNANDSATYTFDGGNEYTRFVIYGVNNDGECADEVTVYQKYETPVCNFTSNIYVASVGDAYTLTWNGTPADASFKINGTPVSDSGTANFTFTGPNTDTFTMTGDNYGETCSTKVVIEAEVPGCMDPAAENYNPDATVSDNSCTYTNPVPTCDSFAANPSVLPFGGGTATLTWKTTDVEDGKVTINQGVGMVAQDGSVPVNVTQTTDYTLTIWKAGHNDVKCHTTVVVEDPNPTPVCNFLNASATTITPGQNVTLTWETTDATDVSINGVGTVAVDGSTVVNPTNDTTYRVTYDGNTNAACTVDIKVVDNPPALTCSDVSFNASATTVNPGSTVNLSWVFTGNVGTASLSPNVANPMNVNNVDVTVNAQTTYTMTLTNTVNTVHCPLTINVQQTSAPDISIIKRDAADGDDTQTVAIGGTANFEIVVTNTGSEDLVDVVVTDPLEANCNRTIGNLAVGASETYTCTSTGVENDFTNVANVTGDSAVDGDTVTDSDPTQVVVPTTSMPVCNFIKASDTSINPGESVVITWETTNASNVTMNQGIGSVDPDGSLTVSPTTDVSYKLFLNGSSDVACGVTVNVDTGGGGGSSAPRCDLDISDEKITLGESITLTWESSRANDIEIVDGEGNIIVTTEDKTGDDKDDLLDGEITIKPTESTTYTMTASRGSRDRECDVEVEIENNVIVLESRNQEPRVAGISLTTVPYTGFDATPTMAILFYLLLTIWALFVTYVFITRRNAAVATGVKKSPLIQEQDMFRQAISMENPLANLRK